MVDSDVWPQFESPRHLISAGSVFYFSATTQTTGSEPWVSDGTAAGTRMLADLAPGPASSFPSFVASVDGMTYFTAFGGYPRQVLFMTDGISIKRVEDDASGEPLQRPREIIQWRDQTIISAYQPGRQFMLWRKDASTDRAVAFDAPRGPDGGLGGSQPLNLTPAGDTLYFWARDLKVGEELWKIEAEN